MNKFMSTIAVVAVATVLLSGNTVSARRVRTNPNRSRFSTASPLDESTDTASQINVDELQTKFSFSDPAAQNFKTEIESDRKSFGVSSGSNSAFSELSSSFGKGLRKKKPSYHVSEEVDDTGSDTGSYEVNYKNTVTHKPGPSFDSGSFKFSSVTSAPKTKFGSSSKFSSFNQQPGGAPSGLFKFNEPSSPSLSSSGGQITTKFAISHPAPTHSAANLGGSYQTFSEETFGGSSSSGALTEKFISDYHSTLAKLKTENKHGHGHFKSEQPKFQSSSPAFKSKFTDGSNFKVSSDFKVGAETQFPKFGASEVPSFKPNFKLQEVPNLYPSDDQFRPSLGFSGAHNSNQLFEPSSDNHDEFVQQQLSKNPASKGQYQQYLKSQQDEKIEQQALQEQLRVQHQHQAKVKVPIKTQGLSRPPQGFPGSSTKFRPYISVKKNFNRRKPLVRVASSPGLSHYRTPAIDGPYTIHFSV